MHSSPESECGTDGPFSHNAMLKQNKGELHSYRHCAGTSPRVTRENNLSSVIKCAVCLQFYL